VHGRISGGSWTLEFVELGLISLAENNRFLVIQDLASFERTVEAWDNPETAADVAQLLDQLFYSAPIILTEAILRLICACFGAHASHCGGPRGSRWTGSAFVFGAGLFLFALAAFVSTLCRYSALSSLGLVISLLPTIAYLHGGLAARSYYFKLIHGAAAIAQQLHQQQHHAVEVAASPAPPAVAVAVAPQITHTHTA